MDEQAMERRDRRGSAMDEQATRGLRTAVHPVVAVAAPFLSLLAVDAVLRVGIARGAIPAPSLSMIVVLLAGVGEAVSFNTIRMRRMQGFLSEIRAQLVLLVGGLILLTLLSGRPFRGELDPFQPDIAWPLFLALVQIELTRFALDSLARRERYLALVAGRTGHALLSASRDAGAEGTSAMEGIAGIRRMEIILQIGVFLLFAGLAIATAVSGGRLPGGVIAAVLLNLLAGVLLMVLLARFTEEQLDSAAGVPWPGGSGLAGLFGPFVGVGILGALGFALAGSQARLPASYLLDLLNRLQAWFDRLGRARGPAPEPPRLPSTSMDQLGGSPFGAIPQSTPSPVLELIVRIVGIVLAAGLALLVLYFLARPLLRRDTWRAARGLHPLRALAAAVQRALRVLGRIPRALAAGFRAARRGSLRRAFGEALQEVMAQAGADAASRAARRAGLNAARQARARRAAESRAVQQFRRIARWGDRNGVPYAAAEGPMEYAARLGARMMALGMPQKADAVAAALGLFERLVYSAPAPEGSVGPYRELSRMVDGVVA